MVVKPILLALLTLGLAACVQQPQAPRGRCTIKEAYSACINTAEGSPENRGVQKRTGCSAQKAHQRTGGRECAHAGLSAVP